MGGSDKKQKGLTDREVWLLGFGIALGGVLSVYLVPFIRDELLKAKTLTGEVLAAFALVFMLTLLIGVGLLVANKVYQRIF